MGKVLDGRLVEYCYVRFMKINCELQNPGAAPGDVTMEIRYDLLDADKKNIGSCNEVITLLLGEDLPSGQVAWGIKDITKAMKNETKKMDDAIAATKKDKSGYDPD